MTTKSKYWKKSEPAQHAGSKWLITFNDLMTLLLTFFVLLFTMGSTGYKDIKTIQGALQSALGVFEPGDMTSITLLQPVENNLNFGVAGTDGGAMEKKLAEALGDVELRAGVSVKETKTGAMISLKDAVLFDSGEAAISEAGIPILAEIAGVLKNVDSPVCVEGHTDDVPIRTDQYPSNWELSVARAVSVVRYFVEICGIRPEIVSAAGYGEMHPLGPNDTPEHRATNRRVEIVLITEGEQ